MTFKILHHHDGGRFVLVVEGFAGVSPVGPRLLRGAEFPDKFLTPNYATMQEAEEAKRAWEEYRDNHIAPHEQDRKSRRKSTRSSR